MRKLTVKLLALFFPLFLLGQQDSAQPLPGTVNSGYNEWAPMLSPGGALLYFARLGHPQNMGDADEADVWMALQDTDGQWARAVNAGAPLNSRDGEYVIGVHASGRRLYLLRPSSNGLFYSDRQGRVWASPQPIKIDSFRPEGQDVFCHLSIDGHYLFLSAEGKESLGGSDLYVSFALSETRFGRPRHLGRALNSSADEQSLFLAADRKTLYFSSDRPGGFGGHDLYMSRRLDDSWLIWSPPINLGAAINTNANERFLALPASGKPAYFLRDNSEGFTDIFAASLPDSLLPEPVALISGKALDAKTRAPLDAEVKLQPVGDTDGLSAGIRAGEEGGFQFILPLEEGLSLLAVQQGYFPLSEPLELSGKALEELDQEQPALLASASNDMEYLQRNEEIERLQLHLRRLDEELIALREQREAARKAISQGRKQDPDYEPFSDPELDALRHRYTTYLQAQPDTLKPEIPAAYSQDEPELQEMKERYERYYRYQKEQLARQGKREDSTYLWEEALSFERLQEEVVRGLEESLAPKVGQELSAGMYEEVKREVARSLSPEEREQLVLKEEKLRQNIRQGFTPPASVPQQWTKKSGAPETEWERKLREGLKTTMEPRVRENLRELLRDDIRAALQNDLTYWAKKETKDGLQASLNEKLQLQIEQERRRASQAGTAETEAVAPLEPPSPSPDKEYRAVRKDLLLAPVELGQSIPLNTVIFEPNKPTLKPVAYGELNRLLQFLKDNSQLVAEIGVHAAGRLAHTNALGLTTQRAQAIVNYLIGNGIAASRVVPKGYGKAFPIADNSTEEGQRLNQRVELRIIGIE